MSLTFVESTFDPLYRNILKEINTNWHFMDQGSPPWKPGDKRGYKEILNLGFELTNPVKNRIYSETRLVDYVYGDMFFDHLISGEYEGPTMDKILNYKPETRMFISTKGIPNQYSTQYGPKIKEQLPRVIKLLKEDPTSRRAVINILVLEDKKIWDISTRHEYPCCSMMQLFIRNNALHLLVNFRSNNMFNTVCYDVYLMTRWLMMIWEEEFPELELGSYYQQNGSSHFFGSEQQRVTAILDEVLEQ